MGGNEGDMILAVKISPAEGTLVVFHLFFPHVTYIL